MRIVLGVDEEMRCAAASRQLARLRFQDAVVDALNVMPPVVFYPGDPLGMPMPSEEIFEEIRRGKTEEGERLARQAAEQLRQDGLTVGKVQAKFGSPVERLMDQAEAVHADLIAVGCAGKSPARAFFTGSVGRGLIISAQQSVLIAKADTRKTGPLRAVLATDHSPYADSCLGRLLEMAPQGIDHLTVVTVYPKEFLENVRPYLPDFSLDPAIWFEQGLTARNQAAIERLAPLGCGQVTSRVMSGSVNESLEQAMKEADAELLILGAQGHGFAERLRLGSTSFHQALSEPYSVFVLRVAPDTRPAVTVAP